MGDRMHDAAGRPIHLGNPVGASGVGELTGLSAWPAATTPGAMDLAILDEQGVIVDLNPARFGDVDFRRRWLGACYLEYADRALAGLDRTRLRDALDNILSGHL